MEKPRLRFQLAGFKLATSSGLCLFKLDFDDNTHSLVGFLHRADRHRLLEDGAGQGKSRNLAIMNLSDDGVQAIIDGYTLTKTVNVK